MSHFSENKHVFFFLFKRILDNTDIADTIILICVYCNNSAIKTAKNAMRIKIYFLKKKKPNVVGFQMILFF
jgi:hypothetical protein